MNPNVAIKVAIVDDHQMFKDGIEIILNYFPDIDLSIKACNGRDLLEQMKNNLPDVILLDLRMPVMDGLATLEEIKRLYFRIKVIILSMSADSSDVIQALWMGADSYLLKSSDPDLISKTIRETFRFGAFDEHASTAVI